MASAGVGLAAAESASEAQAKGRTWVWRGTVTMDVTQAVTSESGWESGLSYRVQIHYPGRWVPGFNRSQWRGRLSWQLNGILCLFAALAGSARTLATTTRFATSRTNTTKPDRTHPVPAEEEIQPLLG